MEAWLKESQRECNQAAKPISKMTTVSNLRLELRRGAGRGHRFSLLSPTPLSTSLEMSASPSRRRRDSLDDGDSLVASSSSHQPNSTSQQQQQPPAPSSDPNNNDDDPDANEIAMMKARVAEMEAEAAKLRELTAASEAATNQGGEGDTQMSDEDREAVDNRSIYVGNVRSFLIFFPPSFPPSLLPRFSPLSSRMLRSEAQGWRRVERDRPVSQSGRVEAVVRRRNRRFLFAVPHAWQLPNTYNRPSPHSYLPTPSLPFPNPGTGRLRFHPGGDPATFRLVRYHQPRHDPLRQVHWSQRVRLPSPSSPISSFPPFPSSLFSPFSFPSTLQEPTD